MPFWVRGSALAVGLSLAALAGAATPERLDRLTERERDAVRLAAQGMSNDEIADHLLISPLTAKTHLNRAMAKLDSRDRAQLVIVAYETGLVRVGARADTRRRSQSAAPEAVPADGEAHADAAR